MPEPVTAEPAIDELAAADPQFARQWRQLAGFSSYARSVAGHHADWVAEAWRSGALTGRWQPQPVRQLLLDELRAAAGEPAVLAALRIVRHRQLFAIAWRDVNGHADLSETLAALSQLAECLIDAALKHAGRQLRARFGRPRSAAGEAVAPVVLGMGKLGGGELNFSSDIDLIFAFSRSGQTDGRRALSNEEYFSKLVRLTVDWLSRVTADGFVYRVDLRLRPFGDAGRVALSFAAMEHYYQRDGREWERYALIKARPVAGDLDAGRALLKSLRPFVFRRYLDYSAFESLRKMKAMIESEVARRELEDNIKLGPGGIREVEFVAQAFQLVHGGRDTRLQSPRLLPTLERLAALDHLDAAQAESLAEAYRFLRRLENRIQQVADQQEHSLPRDEETMARIAGTLGYEDTDQFQADLARHREVIESAFTAVFAVEGEDDDSDSQARLWKLADDRAALQSALTGAGFAESAVIAEALHRLQRSSQYRLAGARGRDLMDRLVPRLLRTGAEDGVSATTLARLVQILGTLGRRTAYLALLWERPIVVERLAVLVGESRWIAQAVEQQPGLLDDLIDPQPATSRSEMKRRLNRAMTAAADPEQKLFALRRIQLQEMLAVAMDFIDSRSDARQTAAALSRVAEVVLAAALRLVESDLAQRHGRPEGCELAVIGYGTLGGLELNFESDLDLVFLVDGPLETCLTDGPKPISGHRFFARVVQRLLNTLGAMTPCGRLYEVDTRLRPNGRSGFLVSSVDAFERYQRESAWTWELQALTRARAVCGSESIGKAFANIRRQVLVQPRDESTLRREVREMRKRLQSERPAVAEEAPFKHGEGGKVAIEFIAQYLRLAGAAEHPGLIRQTDTRSALADARAAGLLAPAAAEPLLAAHDRYTRLGLQHSLGQFVADVSGWTEYAADVSRVWRELMER